MAAFRKRGKKWRAKVRKHGQPAINKAFATKGMSQTRGREVEWEIDRGTYEDVTPAALAYA